jgi:hypothetical protein
LHVERSFVVNRPDYKHDWYLRNRKRLIKKARERYKADPEKVKARAKKWNREHREKRASWLRSWREKNPEKSKAQDQRAYAARGVKYPHPRVSDEILRLCREDPRRASGLGSLAGSEMAVCLECGEKHRALGQHIARRHMTGIAYRKKWGYAKNSGLSSASLLEMQARTARKSAAINPLRPPVINQAKAAEGRRQWAGALQKRLNLGDAHRRRVARGILPTFKRKTKEFVAPKRTAGRPATKRELFATAQAMHAAGNSWARIAMKLDPEGYRQDRHAAAHRIRMGVRSLQPGRKRRKTNKP